MLLTISFSIEIPALISIVILKPIQKPKVSIRGKKQPLKKQLRSYINILFSLAMCDQIVHEFIRVIAMFCFALDHRQTLLLWNAWAQHWNNDGVIKLSLMCYQMVAVCFTVVVIYCLEKYKRWLLPAKVPLGRFESAVAAYRSLDSEIKQEISDDEKMCADEN